MPFETHLSNDPHLPTLLMSCPSPPKYRIAIIGAGPAGCILARLLQPLPVDVTVFESDPSPNFRAQGGTLDLHEETGLYALRKANLYAEFLQSARFDGDALAVCDKHMLRYLDLKSAKDSRWFGQAKPEIDRAELRKLLYDCLSEGTIQWGYKLKSMDASTLELRFENGTVVGDFDLVIGADGAWSKVRPLLTQMLPLFSGTGGYNLVILNAKEKFPDLERFINRGSVFAFSDGKTIMGQQMGDGSIYVSIWGIRGENWMQEAGYDVSDGKAVKKALTEEYKDWDKRLLELIQAADVENVTPRSLFLLPVGMRWESRPGLTLLGDAAHLMTPFTGEGVNTAMRDAVGLAEAVELAIRDRGGMECLHGRTRKYEEEMFARATPVQAKTEDMMHLMFANDAPRTTIEKWSIRAMKDDMNLFVFTLFRLYVYIHFFCFKMLY